MVKRKRESASEKDEAAAATLPDGKAVRAWLNTNIDSYHSKLSVVACLRLARRHEWDRLDVFRDDDRGFEAFLEPKRGYQTRILPGYITRFPERVRDQLRIIATMHNKFMVSLSAFMQVTLSTLDALTLPAEAYEYLCESQRHGHGLLTGKFNYVPHPELRRLFTNARQTLGATQFDLKEMPSVIYKDLVEVYGTNRLRVAQHQDLRNNLATQLRDCIILSLIRNGLLDASTVFGLSGKRWIAYDGEKLSVYEFLKRTDYLNHNPFEQLPDGIDTAFVSSVAREKDKFKYDVEDGEGDGGMTKSVRVQRFRLWILTIRRINDFHYVRSREHLLSEARTWVRWKKEPFNETHEDVVTFLEACALPIQRRIYPDVAPGRKFVTLGQTQLLSLFGESAARFKGYRSVRDRAECIEEKADLSFSSIRKARTIPLRKVVLLLRNNWPLVRNSFEMQDPHGFESDLYYYDFQDSIKVITWRVCSILGTDRYQWEGKLRSIGIEVPERNMKTSDWWVSAIDTDGYSIRVHYRKYYDEREVLSAPQKASRLDVIDEYPDTIDLAKCKDARVRDFVMANKDSGIRMVSIDPGSTYPYAKSVSMMDARNPSRIPIESLIDRADRASDEANVVKPSGMDRSMFFGSEDDKKKQRVLNMRPQYAQYVEEAREYRAGTNVDEIVRRHQHRKNSCDYLLGVVGDSLVRRRATRYLKRSSGLQRDVNCIIEASTVEPTIVMFETGKFRPNKAHPYPIEELKGLVRRCSRNAWKPTLYLPVNPYKTSNTCIACGTKYDSSLPHHIRECRQGECIFRHRPFIRDNYSSIMTIALKGAMAVGGVVMSKFV